VCLRARALASVGWFPEYCITEDYALGMELKRLGYNMLYLKEYLAYGEAPTDMRNIFRLATPNVALLPIDEKGLITMCERSPLPPEAGYIHTNKRSE
jgi:cellulose synthase/poly-beta-1,6-N-acetylglucosamine synthase-like glycosyltransferase